MNSGIYCIKNVKNNKMYIGSTTNFTKREYQHFNMLNNNKHYSIKLQKDYNKYKYNNFKFYKLYNCKIENFIERETYYINKYDTIYDGYNSILPNLSSFHLDLGLLWRAKNLSTKMFHDIKLSDFITNKIEIANLFLLAEMMYKQTNAIMIRIEKAKVKFANIEDMSNILGICERNTKKFISKMIKLKIIAKRIDKIGDRHEIKYLINPLFFFSSKWLSADLYFTFKDMLDDYLTDWQKQMFQEYGNIKGECILNNEV